MTFFFFPEGVKEEEVVAWDTPKRLESVHRRMVGTKGRKDEKTKRTKRTKGPKEKRARAPLVISHLQIVLLVEEDIVWLEISV